MVCSTPGLLVLHHLLQFTQTHVHWVGDAIQPSHPLSSPSPPAFNLSQHQGLFQWVSSLHLTLMFTYNSSFKVMYWIMTVYFHYIIEITFCKIRVNFAEFCRNWQLIVLLRLKNGKFKVWKSGFVCWTFLTCICSLGRLITVFCLSFLICKLIFWAKRSPKYVFSQLLARILD